MKRKTKQSITMAIVIMICVAMAIMIHQWVTWTGHWFEMDQVLHHENIALLLVMFAMGMAAVLLLSRRRR